MAVVAAVENVKRPNMKLKSLLKENSDRLNSKSKKKVIEAVANFNSFGESIYTRSNMKEIVNSISELCNNASKLALQESDDWFDSVTVKRDMKEVAGILKEFVKTSSESRSTQQRMESLYEDLGNKLGRYYDITELKEAKDEDFIDDKEASTDYEDLDDKDLDNDGDEDDSDKYLKTKLGAIAKSVKEGRLNEHHTLGILPSEKLMKMKWNPLTDPEPLDEGASSEEKRIVMSAIKKIAKYRNVPMNQAVTDVMRAAQELEKTIGNK